MDKKDSIFYVPYDNANNFVPILYFNDIGSSKFTSDLIGATIFRVRWIVTTIKELFYGCRRETEHYLTFCDFPTVYYLPQTAKIDIFSISYHLLYY